MTTRIVTLVTIICLISVSFYQYPLAVSSRGQAVTIDGIISTGEYDFNASFSEGDFELYWHQVDSEIYIAMAGKTTGWVALGIDPEFMMKGADMIFGWVTNSGEVEVIDAFATGPTGPHPPDTDPAQGGTNDISEFNGTEIDGVTTIEFKRLLTTTDTENDKSIPPTGEVTIIWAIGSSDNFDDRHIKRGQGTFALEGVSIFSADFAAPLALSTAFFAGFVGLLVFVDSTRRRVPKKLGGGRIADEDKKSGGDV
ncbi:MAG: DOMON domain-containing protein [Candidatus Odinarchaeota archaeon]